MDISPPLAEVLLARTDSHARSFRAGSKGTEDDSPGDLDLAKAEMSRNTDMKSGLQESIKAKSPL